MKYEITSTVEWREILMKMEDHLMRYKEDVVSAARSEKGASNMVGRFDGFRQALEILRAIEKGD